MADIDIMVAMGMVVNGIFLRQKQSDFITKVNKQYFSNFRLIKRQHRN